MSPADNTNKVVTPMEGLAGLALVFGAILGLFLWARASDPVMGFHAFLFVAFCIAGLFWQVKRHYDAVVKPAEAEDLAYNDEVVKAGVIATTFWGLAGFVVGLVIALQLAFPELNFDLPWTNFGRLRPVHEGFDRTVALTPRGGGRYGAEIALPFKGQWVARVRATARDGSTYLMEQRLWLK